MDETSDFNTSLKRNSREQKDIHVGFSIISMEVPCKIVVLGDQATGKTSFVRRYVSSQSSDFNCVPDGTYKYTHST